MKTPFPDDRCCTQLLQEVDSGSLGKPLPCTKVWSPAAPFLLETDIPSAASTAEREVANVLGTYLS